MNDDRDYINTIPHLASPKKIGIYGGSFDPVHLGHMCAVLYALAMHKIDEVWVLPCGEHPEGKTLSPFWHRFKMCKVAFNHLRNVHVIPIEYYMEKPNYTNLTLRAITEHQPHADMYLIVGHDCFKSVPNWNGGEETMELARMLPVPRSGYDNNGHLLPEISSTEIRKRLKGNEDVKRHIDVGVRDYIKLHSLYQEVTDESN